jgi:putative ABC transport system permease protein
MFPESFTRRYRRFWGPDPARDVNEELAFHIEMRVEALIRSGMTEAEAREATMQRFGNLAQIRDECEELSEERVRLRRKADRLDAVRQDLRFALRTFAANPTFTLIAAITMAVGIGANTAVFSVAYGVLFRPLPYRDADALVRLWSRNASRGLDFFSVSPADFQSWRAARGFAAMAAFERQHDATLIRQDASTPESVEAATVMPEMFALLGTSAYRGRTLLPDDARADAPKVAVVSYELWSAHFGSSPALVGSQLTLDGNGVTVVGVMPARFFVPGTPAQVWTPLSLIAASEDHSKRYLRVLARLAPGTTVDAALAQVNTVAAQLARDYPATNGPWTANAMSVTETIVGRQFRRSVLVLTGVVAFVLLIACANAANLQLARAAARQREIALRAALGATRGRITRQLLTESLLLASFGAVGGLLLAVGGLHLMRKLAETTIPRMDEVRLDAPALAFTALIAITSGVLFGLLPAFRASRSDVAETLKAGGRGTGAGAIGQGARSLLVIAEVSLSLILLVGAGLLIQSFLRLRAVDMGFDARGLAVAPIRLPEATYPDPERAARYFGEALERVRLIPGVTSAAAVSVAPFAGNNPGLTYALPDRPLGAGERAPDADYRVITPGYLRTLGLRLVSGRDFTEQDRTGAPDVMLVSETMARRTWPGENPVGRQVRTGDTQGRVYTVVGVMSDARYQSLETPDVRPMVYFSYLARPEAAMAIVARGAGQAGFGPELRDAIAAIDSRIPPPSVSMMTDLLREVTATREFALMLFGVFAATALVLAAVGIYGVMAYLVRQSLPELGIRIALGAPLAGLVAGVVGKALKLAVAGVAIGLVGAWALTGTLSALLFGVAATDRATFVGVSVLVVVVAALASLAPARRATRADPLTVLRGNG